MLANKIVEAVHSVIGDGPHALHEPLFIGNEQRYVADAIASGWVAQGDYIERFEQMLCDFTRAKYAVATCNATSGLQALIDIIFESANPIHIPALTFVATANAVINTGRTVRFEPIAPDISVDLLGMLAPTGGSIRDSAQALGTEGITGTRVYSFNGNKIITTGGGGAIITDEPDLAEYARHLIAQARVPHAWQILHDDIGFNYRMPNINAALGCAQMEQLPHILKAKRALAHKYIEAFDTIGVKVWKEPGGTKSNYWLVSIILDDPEDQESTLRALHDAGHQARMLPTPLHMLPMYKDFPRVRDLSSTEDLWRRTICLPSSPKLGVRYA